MSTQRHLIGALRDFLQARPALAGVPVADGQASRDTSLPYLVLSANDLRSLRIFGGKEIQWVRVECAVMHKGREAAESLGNAIRDLLLPPDDAPAWVPLALRDGWADVNRQPAGGDAIEIDPELRAAFGLDVWSCRRPISWTIARG